MDGRVYEWGKICGYENWTLLQPGFKSGNLDGKKVSKVACGRHHTLAITRGGEVYSWGLNLSGQVGKGSIDADIETGPVKISGSNGFNNRIVSVASGANTSFALDSEGSVSGQNNYKVFVLPKMRSSVAISLLIS